MREKHSAVRSWVGFSFEFFARFVTKLAAPLVVPFIKDRKNHPVWGVRDATDLSYWNIAIRNACHNFRSRPSVAYQTFGDREMEEKGKKYRFQKSLDGKYRSHRWTWGNARPKKGKREFYIGWTLAQREMRPVIQFRPF